MIPASTQLRKPAQFQGASRTGKPKEPTLGQALEQYTPSGNETTTTPRVFGLGKSGRVGRLAIKAPVYQRPFQLELPLELGAAEAEKLLEGNFKISGSVDEKSRILPKDHSLLADSVEILWQESGVGATLFHDLVTIGSQEGFKVTGYTSAQRKGGEGEELSARKAADSLLRDGFKNFQIIATESANAWLEDYSESTVDGKILACGSLDSENFSPSQLRELIDSGRKQRLGSLATDFPQLGGVAEKSGTITAGFQALANRVALRQANSYIEGGNMLSGNRPNGRPYLLVGKDSVEVTRAKLSHQLGQQVRLEDAIASVAQDYGFESDEIVPVEQPGTFHIDMRLSPVGPGEFILQDSAKVANIEIERLSKDLKGNPKADCRQLKERIDQLKRWGEQMSQYERLTEDDLKANGFKVHRVAGAFPDEDFAHDRANFFNARHGTNAQGESYSIFLGATLEDETEFARYLLEEVGAPIDRLYFTDREAAEKTLEMNGGLKCRTKFRGVEWR